MTECERLIDQGIFHPSFFEEEERSGFIVTEERKKIWAIELDLLRVFSEVCNKYGFRYYAIFGTLLGAIRHKGMIPWDDDLDVCMPRDDYERFCEVAVKDFQYPYLLQTPYTDEGYYYSFAKIRNRNTTCMPVVMKEAGFCHGIHLDVFPLDACNPETYSKDRDVIYQSIMKCSSYMKEKSKDLDEIQKEKIRNYNTSDPLSEYEMIQKIASNKQYIGTGFVGTPVNTILRQEQLIWKESDFSDYKTVPFENLEMRIPSGYHNILTQIYGNYMEFPPMEQRGTWHKGVIWNPDIEYSKVL